MMTKFVLVFVCLVCTRNSPTPTEEEEGKEGRREGGKEGRREGGKEGREY
jgi:hypothetical protein